MREFSCLTWNIAKRIKYSEEQVNFINSFKPDVVALQEVLISSDKKLKDLLSKNYKNIVSSFDLAPDLNLLKKKRMFGQIIASNFKLKTNDPKDFNIPWQERVCLCWFSTWPPRLERKCARFALETKELVGAHALQKGQSP